MATPTSKLENCEVCNAEKAKYTCPKCEVRTCCFSCSNVHKKELNCDGIRDKTKFISLNSFTDLDLLSDYRLLEEVGKSVSAYKNNPEKRYTCQKMLPQHLYKLQCATVQRKVSLLFMPENFSRHKENTTYLRWRTNELFWRIEWIFPQAENRKWIVQRALESTRLSTLVEEALDPVSSLEDKTNMQELNIRLNLADKLQFYRAAGLTDIKVLLKSEKGKKSNCRFHELDLTLTLKENLANKIIIEFPTLYLVLKHHADIYEIIDTDEERSDTECEENAKRKLTKNSNIKSKSKEPINYFFNDLSESDDEKIENTTKKNRRSSNINIPTYDELIKANQ